MIENFTRYLSLDAFYRDLETADGKPKPLLPYYTYLPNTTCNRYTLLLAEISSL